jgi:cell surface protein SprA
LFSLVTLLSFAKTNESSWAYYQQVPSALRADTIKKDTLPALPAQRKPSFFSRDRYGDPFSNRVVSSPLQLSNPKSIQVQTQADSSGNITVYEKLGDLDYRPANSMTFDQFSRYQDRRMARDYWQSKTEAADGKSAVTTKGLIPKIYISPAFDRIFGGNYIDFKTNGFVNLDFAGRFQRVANPNIPVRQQSVPLFDFDQQVSLNAIGQVGEKMKVMANFDTKASFQYEQNLKLDYTGFEEDIIQKIEAGNVSMPVNSSLITGAQNLFGLKTQLRFGRLSITSIAANQRASIDRVGVQGGVQTRRFELRVSEYEDNRHFFLSQFFRDNYEPSLRTIPVITSGVLITRLEVYVTNRNNNTQTLRNTVALLDLAETQTNVYRPNFPLLGTPLGRGPAFNGANGLFANVTALPDLRQVDNTGSILESRGLVKGTDFELLRSARRLTETEFKFHPQLGYVSLNTPLRNDEILAVAYEYTYQGRKYKVGELMEDYQNRNEDEVIVLKLLSPSTVRIDLPTWDLMMKNIYSLGNGQINRQGFQLRVIYKDDVTGIDNPSLQEGRKAKDVPLVQLLRMDQLNPQGDPQIDGNFDFIEDITIDSRYGRIIFPVLEPFGSHLASFFTPEEQELSNRYVFNTLYRSTKQEAQQVADKNKFFIKGSFQSSASNEFMLPAINADENSVVVTAGGVPLVNGQDYIVEGQRVRIINESILNSGRPIDIQFEKNDLFNNQTRFLVGTRAEYELTKDFIIGSTLMNLKERPLLRRVGLGNEPTNNSIFGVDANFRKESRFLTALVDKLPLIQTKEISTINISGEYARLSPGVAPLAQNNSFIDDFENAELPFDLGRTPHQTWTLGATPQMILGARARGREYAYRRAKLAWYTVDPLFYRSGGPNYPGNITEKDKENHYVRKVNPQEIFRNRAAFIAQMNESIFDLAYFPEERGMYNYNPDINNDGTLKDPVRNFGAVSRAMTNDIDFDNANIQYIEFWMMDPFIRGERGRVLDGKYNYDGDQRRGGDLYLNLGSISEDIMKDGRHAFENGLPAGDNPRERDVVTNEWGQVTARQFLNNAFENTAGSRARQDIGLDGFNSADETTYFNDYLNQLPAGARQQIASDPSGDDFQYFLDSQLDAQDKKILERYKRFNGMEGNSPEADNSEFVRSATTLPNNEDLNKDNTISDLEEYYQYRISIRRNDMEVGKNNIVDMVTADVNGEKVKWYLFRIPIREGYEKVGNINGFKSIRFMRMFMTNFSEPVVLRLAQYQLVSNQWRQYEESMFDRGIQQPLERYDAKFTLSTVNIEENSQGGANTTPYVIPPGFQRDQDITTLNNRQLNEQSLKMCVDNLRDRDSRAAFKNVNLDLINYKRLKMFLHADSPDLNMQSEEVSAFIRLGTDFTENYYEIEVPLTLSRLNDADPRNVWPEENEIDVAFADLVNVKANRNRNNKSLAIPYAEPLGRFTIRVTGNPDLSAVQILMIGVRNPASPDQRPKSVCIWANELRSNGFDQEAGWAATGRISAKLADFATVTASVKHMTYGFGSIQQKISERARENTTMWDIASNVNLDKLFPSTFGLKIPMFVSYERQSVAPRFNPLDPDMRLDLALNNLRSDRGQTRSTYRKLVEDNITRRSINFTNVQKVKVNPNAKSHFYDIENLSFTYAYSDIQQTNILTEQYLQKNYRTGLAYNYTNDAKPIEPFKKLTFLSSPYLKWLQEFNFSLTPRSVTVRGDLDRTFTKTQLRSADLTTFGILPMYEKSFLFNRLYDVSGILPAALF